MSVKRNLLFAGAVFILVLAVVSFVFIPAWGGQAGQGAITFGSWDGKPIEYVQDSFFVRQFQAISSDYERQGQELNQFTYFQAMQTAFNSAAVRLAMLDAVADADYRVPQSVIDKALLPFYQDETGRYSSKRYNETPELQRATNRALMTEELTAARYAEDVFGNQGGLYGAKRSSKENELVTQMASRSRSFHYVSFPVSAYPDSEVRAFGEANAALFVKHDLSMIIADDEPTAKRAAAAISKGDTGFADAVTAYSTRSGTDATGKLLASYRNDLNALFPEAKDLDAVLSLEQGKVSGILKTGSRFAIVRRDGEPMQPDFSSPSTLAVVRAYLMKNERGKVEDYVVSKAKEFVAKARGTGLDAAAAAEGLKKSTTGAFAINYGNSPLFAPLPVETSAELADAVRNEDFFKTAFSIKSGEISDPILLGSNVMVLSLAEEKAAESEMAPYLLSYYAGQWNQRSFTSAIMKSEKLEDKFMETYLKNFLN
jgi:hypothetical protein